MTQSQHPVARGAVLLLTVVMLVISVVKAQGCRTDETLPATNVEPVIEGQPQAVPAEPNAVVQQGIEPSTDAGERRTDAGAVTDIGSAVPIADEPPPRMLPASKSGAFEFSSPKPAQQQNAAPK